MACTTTQRLAPLVKAAAKEDVQLHFIDAPHELPLQQGQQVAPHADDTPSRPLRCVLLCLRVCHAL
jgi:hypothetical protein